MADCFRKTAFRRIWGFLCSRRLTAALLLAGSAVLLVGLGVPQMPGEVDAAGQAQWWSAVQERFDDNTEWMAALGLFDLFNTPLFVGLLAALLLNNLACTVERLGRLWREFTQRPVVRLPDAAYRPARPEDLGLSGGKDFSGEQARRALRRRGYRRSEEAGGRHYFYAESPPLAPLGTLLTHVGLLLLVPAALWHTQAAWRERLILNPATAQSVALQHRPDCAVRNDALQASREHGALPKGEVCLRIEEGGQKTTGRAAPGAPLAACGVNLYYLDAYDLALGVEAFDRAGNPLEVFFDNGTALYFSGGKQAMDAFALPAWGWHVTVSPSPEALAGSPEGMLDLEVTSAEGTGETLRQRIGIGQDWEGPWGRMRLLGGPVVEIEAVYDPGVAPFLAGGAALALGSTLSLLCPHRRRWVRQDADGTLWVGGAPSAGETTGLPAGRGEI